MTWRDALFYSLLFLTLWFVWLWLSQPRYEGGVYVSKLDRLRKISKRVLCRRDKCRADDP